VVCGTATADWSALGAAAFGSAVVCAITGAASNKILEAKNLFIIIWPFVVPDKTPQLFGGKVGNVSTSI
jgi:hypothetical protein